MERNDFVRVAHIAVGQLRNMHQTFLVHPDVYVNQKGREINTVARAFNSGYGTAEGLQQALDCLKDIAQAAYEVRKEGFTHAP